jgi:hypothetical protein
VSINLQQRFLLLFADYRDAIERETQLGDEVVQLRAQIEEERRRYDKLAESMLDRSERIVDKMLTPAPRPQPEATENPHTQMQLKNNIERQRKMEHFRQQLKDREAELRAAQSNRPN